MFTYRLQANPLIVLEIETGKFIPFDAGNCDYQRYLKWLEDGGVPLPVATE